MIFHLDHKSKASRDNILLNHLAKSYLPRIQFVKNDLRKFRELDPDELQSEHAEKTADSLLWQLKKLVFDCVHAHLRSMQWIINALSLSPEELQREHTQENYNYVNKVKEVDAEITRARKSEKEARREKEAALEKIVRLEAILAERSRQTQPVPANVIKSGMMLFSAVPQKTSTEFTDPNFVLTKAYL